MEGEDFISVGKGHFNLAETGIDILYEDNHLLVVQKPAGILSQSDGSSRADILTLMKADLKERYNKPGNVYLGLVHRLDFEVEGVMVLAKTSKAAARLSLAIRERRFQKRYLAICMGQPEPGSGVLLDELVKDRDKNHVYTSEQLPDPDDIQGGRSAVLEYRVLKHVDHTSLVDINLISGRSHQIRVQFASRGWPLLGDTRYNPQSGRKQQTGSGIALLAHELKFEHPTKKESLCFQARPPKSVRWQAYL